MKPIIEDITPESINLAVGTLTGDVRDIMMTLLRTLRKPYEQMSEREKVSLVEAVEKNARTLVQNVVEHLAADGRRTVQAEVDSLTIKKGLKIALTAAKTEEAILDLSMSQGTSVMIVVADAKNYDGERKPYAIEPDQGSLLPKLGDDSGSPFEKEQAEGDDTTEGGETEEDETEDGEEESEGEGDEDEIKFPEDGESEPAAPAPKKGRGRPKKDAE